MRPDRRSLWRAVKHHAADFWASCRPIDKFFLIVVVPLVFGLYGYALSQS